MRFEELEKYKPHIPFNVQEKDLNLDLQKRVKTYFDDEDMAIDYSVERLKLGQVEIPVFRDSTIRPLGFKGKLLDYELENKGAGFYIITQKRGKIKPKSKDRRHPDEEIDRRNGGEYKLYITYDREGKFYKVTEQEKKFNKEYAEIESLKISSDVQKLINSYIAWIQSFWTKEDKKRRHFGDTTSKQTYRDYLNVIQDLRKNLPMIRSYHLLLNIFGDICDKTYKYIENSINALENRMDVAENHIHADFQPNQLVNHHNDPHYALLTEKFIRFMEERIISRGYFVDREARKSYRNLAEVFYGEQFAADFESDDSNSQEVQKKTNKILESPDLNYFVVDWI
jgi:hypothetical protein